MKSAMVALAVVSLGTGGVLAQEDGGHERRYDLRDGYLPQPGERIRVYHDTKAEVLLTVFENGNPIGVQNKTNGFSLVYEQELLGIDRQRGVIQIKRTYHRVKDWARGSDDRKRHVVVLEYDAEGMSFDREQAEDLPELAGELLEDQAAIPREALDALVPSRPVPLGYRWRIPAERVAQLFLLDPEWLTEGESRCQGGLLGRRVLGDQEQVRLLLQFSLVLDQVFDIVCEESYRIDTSLDVWFDGTAQSPDSDATMRGSAKGTGIVAGARPGVTVQFEMEYSGGFQQRLLPARE